MIQGETIFGGLNNAGQPIVVLDCGVANNVMYVPTGDYDTVSVEFQNTGSAVAVTNTLSVKWSIDGVTWNAYASPGPYQLATTAYSSGDIPVVAPYVGVVVDTLTANAAGVVRFSLRKTT